MTRNDVNDGRCVLNRDRLWLGLWLNPRTISMLSHTSTVHSSHLCVPARLWRVAITFNFAFQISIKIHPRFVAEIVAGCFQGRNPRVRATKLTLRCEKQVHVAFSTYFFCIGAQHMKKITSISSKSQINNQPSAPKWSLQTAFPTSVCV